jgi:hypothetical protein
MKTIAILLCAAGLGVSTSSLADSVCIAKYGMLHCKSGIVDSLSYTGMVDVNGTTVVNSLDIWGNVSLINAKLNSIKIKGNTNILKTTANGEVSLTGNITINEVDFHNTSAIIGDLFGSHITFYSTSKIVGTIECTKCVFKGDTTLIGEIILVDSELQASLQMNFKKADFTNTKVNDVLVIHPDDDNDQTLYLKGLSKVHNITFEGGKGIVILSDNAEINGYVQGGKIEKK